MKDERQCNCLSSVNTVLYLLSSTKSHHKRLTLGLLFPFPTSTSAIHAHTLNQLQYAVICHKNYLVKQSNKLNKYWSKLYSTLCPRWTLHSTLTMLGALTGHVTTLPLQYLLAFTSVCYHGLRDLGDCGAIGLLFSDITDTYIYIIGYLVTSLLSAQHAWVVDGTAL